MSLESWSFASSHAKEAAAAGSVTASGTGIVMVNEVFGVGCWDLEDTEHKHASNQQAGCDQWTGQG
jgi:hypothetical protein